MKKQVKVHIKFFFLICLLMLVLLIIQNSLNSDTHVKLMLQKNFIINLNYFSKFESNINNKENVSKLLDSTKNEARLINSLNVTISELKEIIKLTNSNPDIRNINLIRNRLYQSSVNETTFLVLLIQIHSRLSYLKQLINSLKNTKYIDQTLVVFSHDVYDPEMNKLIESIDFCATLQIFYPYSMQLYPDEFPGPDSNDCPRKIDETK